MCKTDIKKLPFGETVGRSFKYVLKNKELLRAIIPVVGVLTIIQILLGFPAMTSIKTVTLSHAKIYLGALSLAFAAIGIIINYCRSIVCKASVDYLSLKFWKRLGIYFVFAGIFTVIVAIPTLLLITFIAMLGLSQIMTMVLAMVITLAICISLTPLFLAFPAIAVDDYEIIKPKKLYEMAKGNFNTIFWGQFSLMVPYWVVLQMLISAYYLIGVNNYVVDLIFVIAVLFIGMIDAGFKGAFFAHIYQFFKFYDKK